MRAPTTTRRAAECANTIASKANCLLNLPDDPERPELGNPANLALARGYYREARDLFRSSGDLMRAEMVAEPLAEIEQLLAEWTAWTRCPLLPRRLLADGARTILGGGADDCLAEPIRPGPDTLFGPRGVCFAGSALLVCDTGHHRVLGWSRIPRPMARRRISCWGNRISSPRGAALSLYRPASHLATAYWQWPMPGTIASCSGMASRPAPACRRTWC